MKRLTDIVVSKSLIGSNEGCMVVLAIHDPGVGWSGNLLTAGLLA